MASKKISELAAINGADVQSSDVLPIVDSSANETKKITALELQKIPYSAGTANGVPYLNDSKVLTSGSALTFDGVDLATTGGVLLNNARYYYGKTSGGINVRLLGINSGDVLYLGIDSGLTSMVVNASSTSTNIQFNASGSEQMRLTSTGLGIGTSSPNYSLTSYKSGAVANYLQVASGATGAGSGNGLLLGVDSSGNSVINAQGAVNLYTYVAGVLRTTIDSNGNHGLGVTPSSGSKVFAMGNATAPTNNIAGGQLYVEGGVLKYRGSSGTVTTIAAA